MKFAIFLKDCGDEQRTAYLAVGSMTQKDEQ